MLKATDSGMEVLMALEVVQGMAVVAGQMQVVQMVAGMAIEKPMETEDMVIRGLGKPVRVPVNHQLVKEAVERMATMAVEKEKAKEKVERKDG